MPRDSSGAYTLPSGNPVVTGTIIESVWANDTMADIAVQMNNVLTRDGLLGPTQPFLIVNGSAALPGIAFALQPSSGLYRSPPNTIGLSVAGVTQQIWDTTGTQIAGNLSVLGTTSIIGAISSTGQFTIIGSDPGTLGFSTRNNSTGTSAAAGFVAINDAGSLTELVMSSSGFTAFPLSGPRAGLLYADGSGGLAFCASFAGANIRFAAGSVVEQMRLDATGNLGIGTAAPAGALHIFRSGVPTTVFVQNDITSDAGFRTKTASADFAFGAGVGIAGNVFTIYDVAATTERFRIDGSGNVLIRSGNLTVGTSARSDTGVTVSGSATSTTAFAMDSGASGASVIVTNTSGITVNGIPTASTGWLTSNLLPIVFAPDTVERMRIGADGRISIGGVSTGRLTVVAAAPGGPTGAPWDATTALVLGPNAGSSTGAALGLGYDNTVDLGRIMSIAPGAAWKGLEYGANSHLFNTVGLERMRIDATGNVGIGGTSSGARLFVVGPVGGDSANFTDQATYTLAIRRQPSLTGPLVLGTTGSGLGLGANNSQAIWVDTSLNIGIGSTFVSYAAARGISVNNPTSSEVVLAVNGVVTGTMYVATNNFQIGAQSSGVADITMVAGAAVRLRIPPSGVMQNTQAAGTFNLGLDPGSNSASIPIGGIIGGTASGTGYTGLAPLATITLSGSDTITMNGFATSTTLTSGTYRLLNRITAQECMFIRVA